MMPLRTEQPAMTPIFGTLNVSRTSASPSTTSRSSGRSMPSSAARTSVDRLVDDAVQLDVDAFALGRRARVVVGTHVEADDDRARRAREQNVALGDRADAAVNDLDLHLVVRELAERVGQRFRRTALVRLDERCAACASRPAAACAMKSSSVTPPCVRATALRLAVEPLATLRDLARLPWHPRRRAN